MTEAAFPRPKHLINLNSSGRLIKFGTCPVQQCLVDPRRDNGRDRFVSVGLALLIQRVPSHSDESDAESAKYDQSEKDRSKDDQEFFHKRLKGEDACRERSDPQQATKARSKRMGRVASGLRSA